MWSPRCTLSNYVDLLPPTPGGTTREIEEEKLEFNKQVMFWDILELIPHKKNDIKKCFKSASENHQNILQKKYQKYEICAFFSVFTGLNDSSYQVF